VNPRKSIDELKLNGGANLQRALDRAPVRPLAKRAELERMFEEVKARRELALAEIRERGITIVVDKFHREKLYRAVVPNPAVKVAEAAERIMASLARLLNSDQGDGRPPGKSGEETLAEADALLKDAGIN